MSKEKLTYIDYFRAIAIIFIVLAHTMVWGHADMKHFNILLFRGWTFSFVFIAGFLFQYLSYKFQYKEYLKKKLMNVIMPYFVTLTPAAIILSLTLNYEAHPFYSLSKPLRLFSSYIGGYVIQTPLWFVGMIFFIFLLAPVLLFIKKRKFIWYSVLAVTFVYSAFLVKRPIIDVVADSGYMAMVLHMFSVYLHFVAYYLFAYLIGMETSTLCEKHFSEIKQNSGRFLAVLCPIFVILLVIIMFNYSLIGRYQIIPKCIAAYIVLLGLIKFEDKIKASDFWDKSLKLIANYSFGIFFIHQYIINIMQKGTIYNLVGIPSIMKVSANNLRSFLYSVVIFYAAFFGSLIILHVLKFLLTKLGVKNTRKYIGV